MSDDEEQLERWRPESWPMPRIIGTPAEVREVMARYVEIGLDEFVVSDHEPRPRHGRETGEHGPVLQRGGRWSAGPGRLLGSRGRQR